MGGTQSKGAAAASNQEVWADYLRRCAAGDQRALGALYDETSRLVYSVALRILSETADAEEVTLDVYAQVWRSADSYNRSRGSVASWLAMMTRSRSIDRLRSQANRNYMEQPIPEKAQFISPEPGPEQETEWGRQIARVRSAVDSLPPEQRSALQLAVFSGMSHSELAEALQQPLGTVKSRVRLGMMKVREMLEGFSA